MLGVDRHMTWTDPARRTETVYCTPGQLRQLDHAVASDHGSDATQTAPTQTPSHVDVRPRAKTRYDPSEVEPRIVERWLDSGLFHPEPTAPPSENYSIAIPPPNVTGALHMGHALNNSIQDCLIRYAPDARPAHEVDPRHRPRRDRDPDAGRARARATRARAARSSAARRSSSACGSWREQYGGTIIEQLKRLGASCDYDDERFTLDERYAQAVLKVFVALYDKGYIYRDRYMVNWDPGSRSAISDLEVEDREVTDTLYYIDYPLGVGLAARSRSRRCAPRRCSPTPRSRCIPTTSATGG